MQRTEILLENGPYQRIKDLAEREQCSLSSLVRDAVDAYLSTRLPRPSRLQEMIAVGDDPLTCGRDHDEALYRGRREAS